MELNNSHYDKQSVSAVLSRLETEVHGLTIKLDTFIIQFNDINDRLTKLESWKGTTIGIAVVVGGLGSWALQALISHLTKI